MWILSLIPNFITHLILAVGIITVLGSILLGMVPIIKKYKIPLNVAGAILIGLGAYLEGKIAFEEKMEYQVAALRVQLAEARVAASQKNVEIVTEILTDTRVIREKGDTIIRYIDREIVKYDERCEIPDEVINVLNQAATIGLK
jgi:hypothetical protein